VRCVCDDGAHGVGVGMANTLNCCGVTLTTRAVDLSCSESGKLEYTKWDRIPGGVWFCIH